MNDKFTSFPTNHKTITCDYFPSCSGCKNQKKLFEQPKHELLEKTFKKKIPFIVDVVTHYRHRAKLAIGGSSVDPKIGLYQERSHEILPIPSCPLHTKGMNEIIEVIRQAIVDSKASIYSEKSFKGLLRYVQIVQKRNAQEFQLAFSVNMELSKAKVDPFFQKLIQMMGKNLVSLWINEKKTQDNVIFSPNWLHLYGQEMMMNPILNKPFFFHPATFCQVHLPIYEMVLQKMRSWLYSKKNILELYAGVATIGKSLADLAIHIDCYEINPFSLAAFNRSQEEYHDKNVRFYNLSSEDFLESDEYEIVIADPPRKGMSDKVMKKIFQLKNVKELFLLYCDANSFLKDIKKLEENGFILKEVESYLFFPGSDHIEALRRLEKRI